jgi:hypothetical protein
LYRRRAVASKDDMRPDVRYCRFRWLVKSRTLRDVERHVMSHTTTVVKRRDLILATALVATALGGKAQTMTVLATGLNAPMKLEMTAEGNLLVSEATVRLNTGRISIVDRGGSRRTLIDGLPCGPAFPGNAPLGPGALVRDGRTLYIGILEGDALVAGPTPTSHPLPNPNGPGSPIFSSVLKVRFGVDLDRILSGFTLTLDDHYALADRAEVTLRNADSQTAVFELLADFPDTPLDRREVYGHVTPYGMTIDPAREFLYVADAGQNRIIQVNASTGRWQTLVRFPRIPRVPPIASNTETDSVPTSVRFYNDHLLVTFLTGEPFAQGEAVVRSVNPVSRNIWPFINGLTTATDVVHRSTTPGPQFVVSEFRSFLIGMPNSGRLVLYDSPVGRVIANQLNGPTGMVQDPATGDVFVTEFGAGRISQVKLQ